MSRKVVEDDEDNEGDDEDGEDNCIVSMAVKVIFPTPEKIKKYSREQVREMFRLIYEEKESTCKASTLCGINTSTAYGYVRSVKAVGGDSNKKSEEKSSSSKPSTTIRKQKTVRRTFEVCLFVLRKK